ncbi:MAG: DNA-directed RNA polymerase subunit beta', partial [Phycisphaeraceae bacterium]|nr:DNA-directed RNA polymerase subunit beta' [Phycisphaeraceae bacterium]
MISPSQDIVMGVYYLTILPTDGQIEPKEIPSFRDSMEALLAYEMGKVGIHTPIQVRFSKGEYTEVVSEQRGAPEPMPADSKLITSVGRLIFNDTCPQGVPFYNCALGKKGCSRAIDDVYAYRGKPDTIDFLDNMKALGFKHSTIAGLSFGVTDLRIPANKQVIIDEAQTKVDRVEKHYNAGALTERERYNQLLDIWAHCREQVTKSMMKELGNDRRDEAGEPVPVDSDKGHKYLNPVYLMSDSGARGNVSQMQQLAGMRGLMAKPSGEIIETPIRANFREGLNVLEYFSSTHGARKGLADTALKTADSGYLTRKLADVAQNVIINERNCHTTQGISKRATYKGEEVDMPLREQIIGRISRETIRNPITDELIVEDSQIIREEAARKIEDLGIDSVMVRSPLTCDSELGVCAKCYGQDLSTSNLVEEGLAVGIIAAQSIGEPGTHLTMRTFHTGGIAVQGAVENQIKAGHSGTVELRDCSEVATEDENGREALIALKRNGVLAILDSKGRELEHHKVPYGAWISVKPGDTAKRGQIVINWDPHRTPILAEKAGKVRFEDIIPGETVRTEKEESGGKTRGAGAE